MLATPADDFHAADGPGHVGGGHAAEDEIFEGIVPAGPGEDAVCVPIIYFLGQGFDRLPVQKFMGGFQPGHSELVFSLGRELLSQFSRDSIE